MGSCSSSDGRAWAIKKWDVILTLEMWSEGGEKRKLRTGSYIILAPVAHISLGHQGSNRRTFGAFLCKL
jgi:hypothetical protein